MIRLLLADDQALVRGALAALLGLEDDLVVVAEVGRGDEVVEAARSSSADVCLLDIEMPGLDGISVASQLARELPGVRSLIVTTFGRPGYLRSALEAGASGFVVKDTPASELADAVRRVRRGNGCWTRRWRRTRSSEGTIRSPNVNRDVLRAALAGHTVAASAGMVHLSPGTVRNYLSSEIGKTGARTRVEAARRAEQSGWI